MAFYFFYIIGSLDSSCSNYNSREGIVSLSRFLDFINICFFTLLLTANAFAEEALFNNIQFVKINQSNFDFGSLADDDLRNTNESPLVINLDHQFWISKYEITQGEWRSIMGYNPSISHTLGERDNLPVENVSWEEVNEFIDRLNTIAGSEYYRLPTEVEWEYVAKAGTNTVWSFGDNESLLEDYMFTDSVNVREVGRKNANQFGLHDLYGNVYEWVEDWYVSTREIEWGACPPVSGTLKVLRGGSNSSSIKFLRSSSRNYALPSFRTWQVGFRLVRVIDPVNDHYRSGEYCIKYCGNGVLEDGEQCDDGNRLSEDGCESDCTITPFCGDHIVSDGEECDDGNRVTEVCIYGEHTCTVCSDTCQLQEGITQFCGDNVINGLEECDGILTNQNCRSDCRIGVTEGELCSDIDRPCVNGLLCLSATNDVQSTCVTSCNDNSDCAPHQVCSLSTEGLSFCAVDADQDGYISTLFGGNDCDDSNPDVRPNQTAFFSEPTASGSFDYNCDGQLTKSDQSTTVATGRCDSSIGCAWIGRAGWDGSPPGCGQTGRKLTGQCSRATYPQFGCSSVKQTITQTCK